MPCAPCQAAAAAANNIASPQNSSTLNSESKYNTSQLQVWLSKLNCVKLHGLYSNYNVTPSQINSYIGITESAIRNPNNVGYFETELDKINLLILSIISSNAC